MLQAQVVAVGGWLTALPFVDDHLQARLFVELPLYLAHASLARAGTTPLEFKQHRDVLPAWRSVAHEALHLKSNSATAERVFGLAATMHDRASSVC